MSERITIRVDDKLLGLLDARAEAEGISRSALIKKRLLAGDEVTGDAGVKKKIRASDPKQRIAPRFTSRELAAIDQAASAMNVSRSNFIRLAVRSVLWRGPESGKIVTTPSIKKWMVEIVSNIRAIGNNLNQGVRLLHVATDPEGDAEIAKAFNKFSRYTKEVAAELSKIDGAILDAMAAENEYWRPENVTLQELKK